jgi:hypothetical protein
VVNVYRSAWSCESDDEYYAAFRACARREDDPWWCPECGDVEVLAEGEICEPCRVDAEHEAEARA